MTAILGWLLRLMLILASALYFQRTLRPKRRYWVMLLVLGLVMAAFQAIYRIWPACYLFASDAHTLLSVVVTVIEAAATVLALKLLTTSRWPEIILFYSLSLLISIAASLLLFLLSSLLNGEKVAALVATQWNDFFSLFISTILQIGLLLAAAEAVSHYVKKQAAELRFSQFAPTLGAQAASLVILAVLMRETGLYARMLPVLAVLLALYGVADLVLISAFRAFVRNSELARELDALRQMQSMQKDYYLSMDAQLKNAQRMRHDYNNVLQTVDALLARGEAEQARGFAAECRETLESGGMIAYTGNEILDAVLNNKAAEARAHDIRFSVELLLPDPLPIADVDIMSVFSNLLDNALAYVERLPADGGRFVEVSGAVRAGLWVLEFSNAYEGTQVPDFSTTKADKAQHGFGMGIVRTIAKKHGGSVAAEAENGRLSIRIILNTSFEKSGS